MTTKDVPVDRDTDMAPSLAGGPIADVGCGAVRAARSLGSSRWATHVRAWTVSYLFDGMERAFATDRDPTEAVRDLLGSAEAFMRVAVDTGYAQLGKGHAGDSAAFDDDSTVTQRTGDHYGRLFSAFSADSFWSEPTRLLRTRLERNGIDPEVARDKVVLDGGCGGGRYSVAWRLLGARRVVGVDVSETGIADAARRIRESGIDGVVMHRASVLEMPFEDRSFDVTFSNGVLHHTIDWRRGLAELVRVLRPGGLGWLYLIENPGGLFWDVIEILRVLMRGESSEGARQALYGLGISANRAFYMLDHVLVPINLRLTSAEVERALEDVGASSVRRLSRGADGDRIERIHRKEPFAVAKYGVGENRYVFSRV